MKKITLPLSLIVGAALTIPSLAMAAPATNTATTAIATTAAADMPAATADAAMQAEAVNANSEMGTTQSNPFVISETQRISRASGNSINNTATTQAMPTGLQTQQPIMQQNDMQQNDMQMQTQQQDMQDPADDMMPEQDAQEDMMQEEMAD